MVRAVQGMEKWTIWVYAEARVGICQKKTNDTEHFMTHAKTIRKKDVTTQEFDMIRSKDFNFHTFR